MRERKDLYRKVSILYGVDIQFLIAIEECSELIYVLTKMLREENADEFFNSKRKINLIEEVVDVKIMLEQICVMMNIKDEEIKEMTLKKIIRLEERVAKDEDKLRL